MKFRAASRILKLSFSAMTMVIAPHLSAATIIPSRFDTQPTFEVVTSDGESGDLQPGIYGLSKTMVEPGALVHGKVLGVSRAFNGILAQLSMGAATGRNESVAVVNGSLVVFSRNSKPNDPSSRVVIGGSKGILPIDPLTKLPFEIGSVDDIADINVVERIFDTRRTIVLVSIRQPSPFGQGVTYGFVVDAPAARSKGAALKLSHPPLLLNYEFLSNRQLEDIFSVQNSNNNNRAQGAFSHIVLNSLMHSKPGDSLAKSKWREMIREYTNLLPTNAPVKKRPNSSMIGLSKTVPWLNLMTGQTTIPRYPVQKYLDSPITIIQREDPARDLDQVYVVPRLGDYVTAEQQFGGNEAPSQGILGRIDLTGSAQRPVPLVFQSYTGTGATAPSTLQRFTPALFLSTSSVLMRIDGQFHLSFRPTDETIATFNIEKLMKLNFSDVTRLNYIHYILPHTPPELVKHVLLISYTSGKNSFSKALKFRTDGNIFQPQPVVELDKRFQTAEQLMRRALVYEEGIFFDATSTDRDLIKSLQDKTRQPSTHAYMDIEKNQPIFLQARKKVDLISGLSWLGFETTGKSSPNLSGFYRHRRELDDRRAALEALTYGEIKARPKDFDTIEGRTILKPLASLPVPRNVSDEREIEEGPEILDNYIVNVYASESNKGSASTDFLIALDQKKEPVSTISISVQADFNQLSDIHIIRNRRSQKNTFTALFFFRAKGKDKESGGVYAANFSVRRASDDDAEEKPYWIDYGNQDWIARGDIDPSSLRTRIVFDASGAPIWIETPQLDRFDEDFTVIRLSLGKQKGTATLSQLNSNVNFNETLADGELQKSTLSDWSIYFPDQIAKKRTDLKLYSEKKKETKKDREIREKKLSETNATFPTLNEYLDRLVQDSGNSPHTILLVEKEMKNQFLEGMFDRYNQNRGGDFSVTNSDFHFFMLQQEPTPVKYRQEFTNIIRKSGKKLLFVDGRDLVRAQPTDEDGEAEDKKEDDSEKTEIEHKAEGSETEEASDNKTRQPLERFSAPLIRMLAAEGGEKNVASLEQIKEMPKRIPMVVVMTPFEWRRLQEENPEDNKKYLHERFKVDARFLTSAWALWPPRSTRAKPEIKDLARAGISQDAVRVFEQLNGILLDAANPSKDRKHQILIYPDELAPLMEKLIVGRWASEAPVMNTPWNHRNSDLTLLRLPRPREGTKVTQQSIFENYSGLREIRKSKTPVVLAQLSDLNEVGRPESDPGTTQFLLRDPSAGGTAGDLKVASSNGSESEIESDHETKSQSVPHALWLMATEGTRQQPGLGKDWKLRDVAPVETSTIIYGTQGEFNRLKSELGFESRFGNLLDAFDVVYLQEPPVELRRQLVREIFQRHQVRSLDLKFRVGDGPLKDDPADLVSVLISRIEQQANVANQDPTTAFIRVYSLIQSFVSEDKTIRELRVVDKAAVERLLSRVFPTGLKPESQPPNHPINIVKDTTKAALMWQKAGYRGYADLKRQILELYYSQTESIQDQGRPVRFSTIFFGPTSTGKSYLLQTLFDMLGLKPLDALNPNYRESDYFFIKVHELTDTESSPMAVEKILLKAEQLLCNNPQAHIVFDDLHKAANGAMLKRIIAWMSAIFDANKGMISFRCSENERRDIPVMNMGLHITVNPTTDQKMRERVRGRDYLETEILAGLSKDDFILEGSFLARIAAKFNMEKFPAGAKFATLINDARKASQSEFISKEALVLVAPLAVHRLVDRFGEANAREFSSNATVSLMQISHDLPKSPIYLVDLKNTWKRQLLNQGTSDSAQGSLGQAHPFSPYGPRESEVTRDGIKKAIQEIVTYRAVDGDNAGSMLDFVSYIVDGFRIHAYQIMLDGLMEDEQLNSSLRSRQHFIGEMLLATYDSLIEWGTVPLNNLSLHPRALGWPNESKIPEFVEELKNRSEDKDAGKRFFRYKFTAHPHNQDDVMGDSPEELDRRILDVLSETSYELRLVLIDVMKAYFRVKSLDHLPSSGEWFNDLPDIEKNGSHKSSGSELRETLYQAGQRIAGIYVDFTARLFDNDLLERKIAADRLRNPLAPIGSYDQARLFLQALDKAVVSLPWDKMSHFAWLNMKEASKDMNLGHLPRFQDLLFKSDFSPYATVTTDSIFQSVTGNPLYKFITEGDRESRRGRFDRDCQSLLLTDSNLIPTRVDQ